MCPEPFQFTPAIQTPKARRALICLHHCLWKSHNIFCPPKEAGQHVWASHKYMQQMLCLAEKGKISLLACPTTEYFKKYNTGHLEQPAVSHLLLYLQSSSYHRVAPDSHLVTPKWALTSKSSPLHSRYLFLAVKTHIHILLHEAESLFPLTIQCANLQILCIIYTLVKGCYTMTTGSHAADICMLSCQAEKTTVHFTH